MTSTDQRDVRDWLVNHYPAWTFVFTRPHNQSVMAFAVTADGQDVETAWLRAFVAVNTEVASRFLSPDLSDPMDPSHVSCATPISGIFDRTMVLGVSVCVIDIRGLDWYMDSVLPTPSTHLAGIDLVANIDPDPTSPKRHYTIAANGDAVGLVQYDPTDRTWTVYDVDRREFSAPKVGPIMMQADVVRMWAANQLARTSKTWKRRWDAHLATPVQDA